MRWPERLRMLFRSLFRRTSMESELDEELRDHLARETEQNIRSGMSRENARLAALRSVGPVSLYKEECRDARATQLLDSSLRDLRYAIRMLRRAPLFSAAAIVTLALAIGANTAVFTFVENILLRSLPVRDSQQLMALNWGESSNLSYPNYCDYRDRNEVFSTLAALRFIQSNLSLRARDNSLSWGYEVSGNYFAMLGIQPLLGRFFGPAEDDKPNGHPVIVLNYRYWQTHFSADRNVLGSTINISGYPFTVIGVAARGFEGTELLFSADFWIPITTESEAEPGNNWLPARAASNIWALGRLKPGVSKAQAEADLDRIARQILHEHPGIFNPDARFHLSKPGLVGQALRKPVTGFGLVLSIIAALGLLLACVNLASMLLARASDRSREVGIRLAVGAGNMQLLRQFLTESGLLAAAGGLFGFAIAFAACSAFSAARFAPDLPFNTALNPNVRVLGFSLLLTCLTTLLFGLAPAMRGSRIGLSGSLKSQTGVRAGRFHLRDLFVAGQVALSVSLVICSVLVARSLQHALSLNLGFDPNRRVSISFDLSSRTYTREQSRRFDADLIRNVSGIPGMEAVGIIDNLPLRLDHGNNNVVMRTDRPVPPPSQRMGATIYNISPGYLDAAGTRLLAGRDLQRQDRDGAPAVGLINEALSRALFGNEIAVGRHIRLSPDPADKGFEIVGVVETGQYEYLGEDPHAAVFLPIAQTGTTWTTLLVHTRLPAQTAVNLMRKSALDLNPDLSFAYAGSLRDQLALPLFPARAAAVVLGSFGVFAMLLAATGLFALMAYAVSRRAREIGLRMALGAKRKQILSAVLRRTLILCTIGLAAGTLLTLASARLLSFVLYGVSPRDPLTYVSALLLMLFVALGAVWHPALRAIRIDPAVTLREQ